MKKYLVIGNPIQHSLSPKLHNYWINNNNIDAIYEKKKLEEGELKDLISKIRNQKIHGANITVPFKKLIIPYLDQLSLEAEVTQSVNTIYTFNNKIIGHNTDIDGFQMSIKECKFDLTHKKIFILGAGGVVPSIIFALSKMKVSEIIISNRTKKKVEDLQTVIKNLKIVNWGEVPDFDMIINATSVGLKKEDKLEIDLSKVGHNKFFYDVIYNPKETNFLQIGKKMGNLTENGLLMFVHQASAAFKVWHGVQPKINKEIIKYLNL